MENTTNTELTAELDLESIRDILARSDSLIKQSQLLSERLSWLSLQINKLDLRSEQLINYCSSIKTSEHK